MLKLLTKIIICLIRNSREISLINLFLSNIHEIVEEKVDDVNNTGASEHHKFSLNKVC